LFDALNEGFDFQSKVILEGNYSALTPDPSPTLRERGRG
jgi:hypothetical protein